LLQKVKESGLSYLAYTKDMITYSDDIELAKVFQQQELKELKIIGIGVFGSNEKINALTKKFSL